MTIAFPQRTRRVLGGRSRGGTLCIQYAGHKVKEATEKPLPPQTRIVQSVSLRIGGRIKSGVGLLVRGSPGSTG